MLNTAIKNRRLQKACLDFPELGKFAYALQIEGYASRTVTAYLDWCAKFVAHFPTIPAEEMGASEVVSYLEHLEDNGLVLKSRAIARGAILCFFAKVFDKDFASEVNVSKLCRAPKTPLGLSKDEAKKIITNLEKPYSLLAELMFETGIRLMECLRIRLKDVVHLDKGHQCYIKVYTDRFVHDRTIQVKGATYWKLKEQYEQALTEHDCLGKLENQYLFPSKQFSALGLRPHLHPSSFQRAVRKTGLTLNIKVSAQILRNSFALNHLREDPNAHPHRQQVQQRMGLKTYSSMIDYVRAAKKAVHT